MLRVDNINSFYGKSHILQNVSLQAHLLVLFYQQYGHTASADLLQLVHNLFHNKRRQAFNGLVQNNQARVV